jgi:hypothetical protein
MKPMRDLSDPDQATYMARYADAKILLVNGQRAAGLEMLLKLYPIVYKQAYIKNNISELLNLIAMDLKDLGSGLYGFNWD